MMDLSIELSNESLEKRNKTSAQGLGFVTASQPPPQVSGDAHPSDCSCHGAGFFLGTHSAYDQDLYKAPPGRLLIQYCGIEDALSDEAILAAYGTTRDENVDIDKWGVMVVEPRPEHASFLNAR